MAMSFEESLQVICREILPSPADCKSLNDDAENIRKQLIEAMKCSDITFEKAFDGLSLSSERQTSESGQLVKGVKLPDELEVYLKLKMPFTIIPQEDVKRSNFVMLTTPNGIIHPLVRQGLVSRQCLQDWIRNILLNVIGDGNRMKVNNRPYMIEYPNYGRGYGVVHTILARELPVSGRHLITFDLVPAFEFEQSQWPLKSKFGSIDNNTWFAIPYGKRMHNDKERSNKFAFMSCIPKYEYTLMHDKLNLWNSMRLLKAIRDVKGLELLTNYMLKSIYVEQCEVRPIEFWKKPIDVILIEIIEVLIQALRHNYLPFFVDDRFKNLKLLRKELYWAYPIQLSLILKNFQCFQKQSRVNYTDVAAFSYVRTNYGHRSS